MYSIARNSLETDNDGAAASVGIADKEQGNG